MTTDTGCHDDTSAAALCEWARRTVAPSLRTAVETLPAEVRLVAQYHLGLTDEHGHSSNAWSGKALRPALTLLSAEAVGTATSAVPAAVAVELVHNFSLLHDDVMDQDRTRRHRPTAWTVFGSNVAILTGDALSSLASAVLADSANPAAPGAIGQLNAAVQELIRGQAMDLAFERREDVDLSECQSMAQAKTGALLGVACELGAAFAGGTEAQRASLRLFGERLGLAFQHVDDLLGIWGDPEATGKPGYSDLRGRKKTLPVVAALKAGTPAARQLATRYHGEDAPDHAELAEMARLVDAAGGRAWSESEVDQLLRDARCQLDVVAPAARTRGLREIADLVARRDR
ncbi:polyprenyl synthetase family protein [Streptomyces oceani]|uniref:Dimethylallyltranstransferase n=1 Tax=Streptomyces oceani TaxID=1075402 RepID=A0A1E7JZ33_9ACTN|nr:polyprenyl synthetase family protein [Streptomyces oceani]OEU96947.1 dimethylallyltranstransferase [Streptomyces oceani]